MQAQDQQPQGRSALDEPIRAGTDGPREVFPPSTYLFTFLDLKRGYESKLYGTEQCRFEFRCDGVLKARRVKPTQENPSPKQAEDFIGAVYHRYMNWHDEPSPRSNLFQFLTLLSDGEYRQGVPFYARDLLMKQFEVVLIHNERGYAEIAAITPYEDDAEADDEFEPPVATTTRRSAKGADLPF
jgi:hypothetical protein